MKKLFLIIMLIAVIAIAGCDMLSNKNEIYNVHVPSRDELEDAGLTPEQIETVLNLYKTE